MKRLSPLELEIVDLQENWRGEIRKALRRVENRRRSEAHLPLWPPEVHAWLPTGKNALLQFLNWKVWSMRYCVSLDFILDVLLYYYRSRRNIRDAETDLRLGVSVSILTGAHSRSIVEEAIIRTFPNGENYKSRTMQYSPLEESEEEESLQAMIRRYCDLMQQRQLEAQKIPVYRRNFRRTNRQVAAR